MESEAQTKAALMSSKMQTGTRDKTMDDARMAEYGGVYDANRHILTAAKGGAVTFAGRLFGTISSLIFAVIVVRFLGAGQYGLYKLAVTIMAIAAALCYLGLDGGLTRYIPIARRERNEGKLRGIIQVGTVVPVFISVILTVILLLIAEPIATDIYNKPALYPVLRVAALALPLLVMTRCLSAIAQGFKQLQYDVYAQEITRNLIKIVLSLVVLMLGFGVMVVTVVYVVASAVGMVMLFYFVQRLFPFKHALKDSQRNTREIFHFSGPLYLQRLLSRFGREFETILLGYFGVLADVGVYAVILRLSNIGNMFYRSLIKISRPLIAELHSQDEYGELKRVYQTTSRWALTFNLPIFVTILLFGEVLLSVFGQDFRAGSVALIILAGAALFNASTGASGSLINMSGHSKIGLLNSIVYLLTTIVLDFVLIPQWYVLGAACAAALTIAINNTLRLIEVYILIPGMLPFNRSVLKPVAATLVAGGVTYTLDRFIALDPALLKIVILVPIMWIIYAGAIVIMRLSEEDWIIVNETQRRLRRWKR